MTIPFAAAPELTGPNRFVAPRDFIWDDNLPVDLDGHGTHVAGTIGQLTNNGVGVAGMAFNVRLMPVKVIGGDWDFIFGAPNEATTSVVAAGIRYAADNGAQVINMSLGFEGTGPLPAIEEALRYAVGKGAFVTVAAGNGFEDGNPEESLAEIAANMDGVISVGAVGRTLDRAFYSSSRSSVEIAAPGGDFRAGGEAGGVIQQTYDPARVGGRSAVEPGVALPRAALRHLRLRGPTRARRWRRPTSRAWPRCSSSRASPSRRRSRRRSSASPPIAAPPGVTTTSASA